MSLSYQPTFDHNLFVVSWAEQKDLYVALRKLGWDQTTEAAVQHQVMNYVKKSQ